MLRAQQHSGCSWVWSFRTSKVTTKKFWQCTGGQLIMSLATVVRFHVSIPPFIFMNSWNNRTCTLQYNNTTLSGLALPFLGLSQWKTFHMKNRPHQLTGRPSSFGSELSALRSVPFPRIGNTTPRKHFLAASFRAKHGLPKAWLPLCSAAPSADATVWKLLCCRAGRDWQDER